MPSFLRRPLIALCVWEALVIAFLFAAIALTSDSGVWDRESLLLIAELAAWGLLVVGIVGLLSRYLGKIGGAIVGLLAGLLPTFLMLAGFYYQPRGFEEGSGVDAIAGPLAIPSILGGALAGIICSRRKPAPAQAPVTS